MPRRAMRTVGRLSGQRAVRCLVTVAVLLALDVPVVDAEPGRPAATRTASRVVALTPLRTLGESGSGDLEFHRPGFLATAPTVGDNGVLVADVGNVRVELVDLTGRLIWEAGGLGTEEGFLRRPTAVAVATGLTYLVLDSLAGRVLEFHARGEFLGVGLDFSLPALADRLGEVEPRDIVVLPSGNAIITDREGDRLLMFSPDWEFLYEVGGFGYDAESFQDPEGLAANRDYIWVADSMNGRVQRLDIFGGFVDAWSLPDGGLPVAVALDRHDNLFVADAERHRIVVFDPGGSVVCQMGERGRALGAFRRPSGVCVVDGHLVVADADNDRLQILKIDYAPR